MWTPSGSVRPTSPRRPRLRIRRGIAAGAALVAGGLIGVVAPAVEPVIEAAGAAPVVLPYACSTTFVSGGTFPSPALVSVEDTSATPGVADLDVVYTVSDPTLVALLNSVSGTTQWTSTNATIEWNGVTSPGASFVATLFPEPDPISFSPAPFSVPAGPGAPGAIEWDFVSDATVPGFASGHHSCTPAADLAVTLTHTGDFVTGQRDAEFELVVTNVSELPSTGQVALYDNLPITTPQSMSGAGWACAGNSCFRSDVLAPGASYPVATFRFEVPGSVTAPLTNAAEVVGAGDAGGANNHASDVATFSGFRSYYTPLESSRLDQVGTFLGVSDRTEVQRTGALFLAYLDALIQGQGTPPPNLGSDYPLVARATEGVTTTYSPADLATVSATAAQFSTDVSTLQRRGVLLLALIIGAT